MKKKQYSELEQLRRYVRKTLNLSKHYRINWPDDLFLADIRNTPLLPRRP